MTLIVGIKCVDGIVMASDGAATLGALGQNTIRQTTTKLDIVETRAIAGVSGPVGLGQLLKSEVQTFCQTSPFPHGRPLPTAMAALRDAFWKQIGPAIEHATVAGKLIGQTAFSDAICNVMVAVGLKDGPALIQFTQQAAPEAATEHLPFFAIGSGQPIADPFLAFLRRVLWNDALPTLAEGIFSAVWTLDHAIQTNAGGVADPIQIVVLERAAPQGKTNANIAWKPRQLSEQDIQQHLEWIDAHEREIARFHKLDFVAGDPDNDVPAPPVP